MSAHPEYGRRADDGRLERIEGKIDHLEAQLLKLWQNGLSAIDKRVTTLEASHAARRDGRDDQRATVQRWMTILGWLVTAVNTLGVALILFFLNHAVGPK